LGGVAAADPHPHPVPPADFTSASSAQQAQSSSQHLSNQRRRTNCDELMKVLLPLLLIACGKIWHEHVIHVIWAGELRP
jgi:hypothetical protein